MVNTREQTFTCDLLGRGTSHFFAALHRVKLYVLFTYLLQSTLTKFQKKMVAKFWDTVVLVTSCHAILSKSGECLWTVHFEDERKQKM